LIVKKETKMRYKKNVDESIDTAYKSSLKYGFNIKLSDEMIFYRKGLHWEYIQKDDITRIYRQIEPVSSYGSCCADSMDIQRLVVVLKNDESVSIHICDGEEKLAETVFSRLKSAWPDIEYRK